MEGFFSLVYAQSESDFGRKSVSIMMIRRQRVKTTTWIFNSIYFRASSESSSRRPWWTWNMEKTLNPEPKWLTDVRAGDLAWSEYHRGMGGPHPLIYDSCHSVFIIPSATTLPRNKPDPILTHISGVKCQIEFIKRGTDNGITRWKGKYEHMSRYEQMYLIDVRCPVSFSFDILVLNHVNYSTHHANYTVTTHMLCYVQLSINSLKGFIWVSINHQATTLRWWVMWKNP